MTWLWLSFAEMTSEQLYEVLRLRQEVFVVEQKCPYLDADGLDGLAMHLMAFDNVGLVAYARVLPPGVRYAEPAIGRALTAMRVRRTGIGREMMRRCIAQCTAHFGKSDIRISAQTYLKSFYESFGFSGTGKEYLEDDIPHMEMLRKSVEPIFQ